jgi:5'-nucleotidase
MRILITNDDGIEAPGLRALYGALKDLGEIAVSAPDCQHSAAGHSITLHSPFSVRRGAWSDVPLSFAVGSTPADCVRLAVLQLLPWKPDLVVSGINHGANYGTLVLYSGTVAAAAEAAILHIPSFAVSNASYDWHDYTASGRAAAHIARVVGEHGMPPDVLFNVNVPPLPPSEVKGMRLTHQGDFRHVDDLMPHETKEDHYAYVWGTPVHRTDDDPGSDVSSVKEGFIAVTPIQLDLTARAHFDALRRLPLEGDAWRA